MNKPEKPIEADEPPHVWLDENFKPVPKERAVWVEAWIDGEFVLAKVLPEDEKP